MTYGSMPANPRDLFRQYGLPYSPRSIPQLALDVPLVTTLPRDPQDGTEVNLVGSGNIVDRYIYLRRKPGWVRMNDTVNQSVVTTLPSSPSEGDQVIYDTDTAGVRWHLVYDTSDGTTYPWLCIGGSPLFAEVATQETTTSATFTNLATTGPTVTPPLGGDYVVELGCRSHVDTNAGFAGMSYSIGVTAASDNDAAFGNEPAGSNTSPRNMMRRRVKAGLSAAGALTAKYRVNNAANTATFESRWISITPVRVG